MHIHSFTWRVAKLSILNDLFSCWLFEQIFWIYRWSQNVTWQKAAENFKEAGNLYRFTGKAGCKFVWYPTFYCLKVMIAKVRLRWTYSKVPCNLASLWWVWSVNCTDSTAPLDLFLAVARNRRDATPLAFMQFNLICHMWVEFSRGHKTAVLWDVLNLSLLIRMSNPKV